MAIDLSKLTLGEIDTIESLTGVSIDSLSDDGARRGKPLAALLFIAKRRAGETTFTFNEALGFTPEEANNFLGFNEPDEPEEESSPTPSSRPKPRSSTKNA